MKRAARLILFVAVPALLGGCVEERVISVKGGIGNFPGAEGGVRGERPPDVGRTSLEQVLAHYNDPDALGEPIDDNPLRRKREDGSIALVSLAPRHVQHHIARCIINDEYDLLYDQIISEATKAAYREAGRDPRETIDWIRKNREEILTFFALFPNGELTPGMQLQNIGRKRFRLTPGYYSGVRFRHFDTVTEGGSFKLLLIH